MELSRNIYKKRISDDSDYFFNEDITGRLTVKVENNWKHNFLN